MLKIISFRDRFPTKAKSDITCYKVLEYKGDHKSIAYSPYQGHIFTLKHKELAILQYNWFKGDVKSGIHAFLNKSDALKLAQELRLENRQKEAYKQILPAYKYNTTNWNWLVENHYDAINNAFQKTEERQFEVFECSVPKGAKYFNGVWEKDYPKRLVPNIAAAELIVLRNINDEPEEKTLDTVDSIEQTINERLANISAKLTNMVSDDRTKALASTSNQTS